jgi:hypothetical protein
MREYLVLPPELAGSADSAEPWVVRALAYAQQLPPKVKR